MCWHFQHININALTLSPLPTRPPPLLDTSVCTWRVYFLSFVVKRLECSWLALRHSAKLTCICLGDMQRRVIGGGGGVDTPLLRIECANNSR